MFLSIVLLDKCTHYIHGHQAHRRQRFGSLRAFFMSVCAASFVCLGGIVDVHACVLDELFPPFVRLHVLTYLALLSFCLCVPRLLVPEQVVCPAREA